MAVEHPALRELGELADTRRGRSFRCSSIGSWKRAREPAQVVATFANGKPALVERQIGAGSVLDDDDVDFGFGAVTIRGTCCRRDRSLGRFWRWSNGIVQHLAGAGRTQLNYLAGQTIVLPLSRRGAGVELRAAAAGRRARCGNRSRQGSTILSIATTEALGNYRVRAGGRQERLDRGFSVNAPAEMARLDRVPAADAVKALGSERARVATNREEIEMRVGLGRVGRELFPILILAVALAMAAEQLLANRFYSGAAGAEKVKVGEWEKGREGGNATNSELPALPSSPSPTLDYSPMNFEIRFQPVVSLTVVVLVTAVLLGLLFDSAAACAALEAAMGGADWVAARGCAADVVRVAAAVACVHEG